MIAATLNSGGNNGGFRTEPGEHLVAAYRTSGNCGAWDTGDRVDALNTFTDPNSHIVAFDTTQITSKGNFSNPQPGGPCHPLASGAHAPAIAYPIPIDMRQASRGATMTNNRKEGSSGGAPGTGIGEPGDPSPTIATNHVPAVGFALGAAHRGVGQGHNTNHVAGRSGVRRLTPRECERLQGFPDDWTAYGADGKPISDSARYRMLGNSVAVPCVEWIARRLMEAIPCPT